MALLDVPAQMQRRMSRRTVLVALAGILVVGTALRLYHLEDQSIWWDEASSLTVGHAPLAELFRYLKLDSATPTPLFGWNAVSGPNLELNPPVYFVTLHEWFNLFGFGPLQARLMSAVASALALVMVFILGVRLYDVPTGLTATLLLAISQLGIMYAQEARNYALLLLLFLITVYLYVTARLTRSIVVWCCCTVSAVLMVGTHYYGGLAVLALGVHTALEWRREPIPIRWLGGSALAGLAVLGPWMVHTLRGQIGGAGPGGYFRWNAIRLTTAASSLNKFNNGAVNGIVNTMPRWTFVAGGLLFTAPAVLMTVRLLKGTKSENDRAEASATALCLLTGLIPFAAVMGFGLGGVKFDIRYVAFCIAPYYLLVAAGISRLRSVALRWITLTAIVCYSGYALRANYWIPYKEDFRDAAGYVSARAVANDCYVFVPGGAPPLGWRIYMPGPPGAIVRTPDRASSSPECQRTWVVTYERGEDEAPIPSRWRDWLGRLTSTNQKVDDRHFFWIHVELYRLAQLQTARHSRASAPRP